MWQSKLNQEVRLTDALVVVVGLASVMCEVRLVATLAIAAMAKVGSNRLARNRTALILRVVYAQNVMAKAVFEGSISHDRSLPSL